MRRWLLFRKSLTQRMERAKGFEPSAQSAQVIDGQRSVQSISEGYTQIRAQFPAAEPSDLQTVVSAWSSLSKGLKAAILAIVHSATAEPEGRP